MNTRDYRMRKRAEQVAETRQRITEAAMRLHTTVGPANTTISGVAEEAGVTRVTVYNHFPDEETLFLACSAHWAQLHPPPDPAAWEEIDDRDARVRRVLTDLYGWYEENHEDLFPIMRDFEAMPEAFREGMAAQFAGFAETLVTGSDARGRRRERLTAVAGHLTSFWTWHSLVIQHGLTTDEAIDLACEIVGMV